MLSTSSSTSSTSSEEKKSSTWVYHEDMAIHQALYDEMGVMVLAPSDQVSRINTFDTKNSFSLAGETFLYGERHTIQGCDLWLRLSLESLDEDTRQKAQSLNTPVLVFEGDTFSLYGDKEGNGQWGSTPITKSHQSLKKLPFEEGIIKRSQLTQFLIAILKEGHAAFDKEVEDSVASFAKADALMQQLQAVAYYYEPRSGDLLDLLQISYDSIESDLAEYWGKKMEEEEDPSVLKEKHYQKHGLYQTILSILTIIYGYTEEVENTRVIYRTSRPSITKDGADRFKRINPTAYLPHYQTTTRPVPFLPFRITDGLLPNGFANNIAVRIHPLEIVMGEKVKYSSNNFFFRGFFFSYSLFGLNLVGKLTDGTEIPLTIHPINVPKGQKIKSVEQKDSDFFECEQLGTLKVMSLIMERLGGRSFQAVCHLHWIEYLIMGVHAWCLGKIELSALEMLIQLVKTMKDAISEMLIKFFAEITDKKLKIISPFDNLIGDVLAKNMYSYAMPFLQQLGIYGVKPTNEEEILDRGLEILKTNSNYPEHAEIWANFIDLTKRTKDRMWTLEKMFAMANVIAVAMAAHGMPSFGLCCIPRLSEMPTMELANVYLKMFEKYNSLLALMLFPPCIALNAPDVARQQRKYEGSNYRYRDTTQQGAYRLIEGPLFFKSALRRGADAASMPVREVVDQLQKNLVAKACH